MNEIIYGKDIIVFVKIQGKSYWYISDWRYWIIDYKDFEESTESRFGITKLDENNFSFFHQKMQQFFKSTEDLSIIISSKLSLENDWWKVCHLLPSVYIDFDTKVYFSNFYETVSFEDYVPSDWKSDFIPFYNYIPLPKRYWVVGGNDLLVPYTSKLKWEYSENLVTCIETNNKIIAEKKRQGFFTKIFKYLKF